VVGEAGIMVAPTDADALCQGMLAIYRNPSLGQALSAKSIRQAGKFSWQKSTQATIRAYQAVLSA
jgi:glycosyltransferase involved in cell wall biosynthesis